MFGTVLEAARLLRPGGHFCFCVTHPVTDTGQFVETDDGEVFALRQPYFESQRVEDTVEAEGLPMTFRGWTYTLEEYLIALERAGLMIEHLREPKPSYTSKRFERWERVPLFMMVRTVKP